MVERKKRFYCATPARHPLGARSRVHRIPSYTSRHAHGRPPAPTSDYWRSAVSSLRAASQLVLEDLVLAVGGRGALRRPEAAGDGVAAPRLRRRVPRRRVRRLGRAERGPCWLCAGGAVVAEVGRRGDGGGLALEAPLAVALEAGAVVEEQEAVAPCERGGGGGGGVRGVGGGGGGRRRARWTGGNGGGEGARLASRPS